MPEKTNLPFRECLSCDIQEHRFAETLDHPDGSVTYEKLSPELKAKIDNDVVFIDYGDTSVVAPDVINLAAQGKIVCVREEGAGSERIGYFFEGTGESATFYGHLSACVEWFVRLAGSEWTAEIINIATQESFDELKEQIGDIDSALDGIIAIQNSLIGGDSE